VTGKVTGAISYRFTNDGRSIVQLNLSENGSAFVVFRENGEENHIISVNGPGNPEVVSRDENPMKVTLWESGEYVFDFSNGNETKIAATVESPLALTGSWEVSFEQEGNEPVKTTFENLMLWNEHSDPYIKYFSGTAVYRKSFSMSAEQVKDVVRLQLGEVFNISRVWLNDQDLGVIWTTPWQVDLTGSVKEGTNELKIEVTNCWSNRLIGDAGLPPEKRSTNTNVRLVTDREKFRRGFKAVSTTDPLMPSGLAGPVIVKFGISEIVNY